jgi:hypothetical protein
MPAGPDEQGIDAEVFGRVLDVGRRLDERDFERSTPPDELWARISAAATADDQPHTLSLVTPHVDDRAAVSDGPRHVTHQRGASSPGRGQRWVRPLAVAAAVVLAAATVGVVSQVGGEERQELAAVSLDVLQDGSGTADASLVDVAGAERLVIDLADVPPAPEGRHYELWLIDVDVTDPVSLGEVPAGTTTVEVDVPDGLDPDEYPIVDINLQEDGVAEHSGLDTSVLRGVLA